MSRGGVRLSPADLDTIEALEARAAWTVIRSSGHAAGDVPGSLRYWAA